MGHLSEALQPISLDYSLSVVLTFPEKQPISFSSLAMTPLSVQKLLGSLRLLRRDEWFVTTLTFHRYKD